VSETFLPVLAGHAETGQVAPPSTPRNVPYQNGTPNPSAEALRAQFGDAVQRVDVVWGETTVFVHRAQVLEIVRWLHDDPTQQYDYLSDVTAVEYRHLDPPIDDERPLR
jgi:NADH-quinone oxidoreductase subunit C